MAARSIWKGTISFGLVNIPIKLYSATEGKTFSFNQLCEKGHRIQYKRWCTVEDKEIPWEDIHKGFEIAKGNYVLVEKEDFEKIKIKTTKSIDIKEFVSLEDLNPILIEKSYYVGPDTKTIDKAYVLFANILKSTNKIAIGKVVLKDKEHLIALQAYQRGIVMYQLHYQDEIKPLDEIEGIQTTDSSKIKIDEQEISLGKTLIENLTSKGFDPSKYSDTYATQLEEMINAKAKGKSHVIQEPQAEPVSNVDLLEALKASVAKSKSRH